MICLRFEFWPYIYNSISLSTKLNSCGLNSLKCALRTLAWSKNHFIYIYIYTKDLTTNFESRYFFWKSLNWNYFQNNSIFEISSIKYKSNNLILNPKVCHNHVKLHFHLSIMSMSRVGPKIFDTLDETIKLCPFY